MAQARRFSLLQLVTPSVGLLLVMPSAVLLADSPLPSSASGLAEADRDRIHAEAQYATAETLFEEGDLEGALRHYQRAWRWDPSSTKPLEKIVPLAFSLGRIDEAVRYTLKDAGAADPALLRRLGLYLTEQQDWDSSLAVYRQWLELTAAADPQPGGEQDAQQRTARLLVQLEVARLEYLTDEVQAASESFAAVQAALEGADTAVARSLQLAMGGSPGGMWEVFGRCHLDADKLKPAREAFEQMAAAPDLARRAGYWLAEVAAEEGQTLVAYDLLKQYFATGDQSLGDRPFELLSKLLDRLRDSSSLRSDLERIAAPGRPFARAALADALAASGDAAAAESMYRDLLAKASDDRFPEQLALQSAEWLILHLTAERRQAEILDLLPAIGAAVDDFSPLGAAVDAAMQDITQAGVLLGKLKDWPAEEQPLGAVAAATWLVRRAGVIELATKLHEIELRLAGDGAPDRALAWAVELLFADQTEAAAQALRSGIDRGLWGDEAPEPHFYLATALALSDPEQGDQHDAALAAAREAARRAPDSADVVSRVAWVLLNADRNAEAVAEYKHFIETFFDDPDPATRDALKGARLTLSYLELEEGKVAEAQEWLEQVLDEFPDDPGGLNDLAYLWAARDKHLERAERMAGRAVAAEPESAAYLDTLAWAQFRLGRAEAALETINRAIALEGDEPDGEILDHQGDILAALGRAQEAAAAWRAAAESFAETDPDMAETVRKKLESAKP